jgi:DUF1365 family protein
VNGAGFCFGHVMHHRLRPVGNRFVYPAYFLRLRIGDERAIGRRFLSVDRFNLLSFHVRDHGARDGSPLGPWIRGRLRAAGLTFDPGDVWLHTFPRVLGYVFNPVSFFLCHDRAGGLRAVLAEVSNTFGEHHDYLLSRRDGGTIGPDDWLEAPKTFHVSPFFDIDGDYRFRFRVFDAAINVRIDYGDAQGTLLATAVGGRFAPLGAASVRRALTGYPLMTLGVIARIHWQAAKLWWRGVRFHRKPAPPETNTTHWETGR